MAKEPSLPEPSGGGDSLSTEVSITGRLEESGFTVAGKARALAAADQLLGGLIGIPSIVLENFRAKQELKGQLDRALMTANARRALAKLEQEDDVGIAAAAAAAADDRRRFVNRAKVWVETEEAFKALPPPKDGDSASQEMDPDWMNLLSDYAGRASTERLQQLWGRILAGEVRQPGAFSLSTLRVISEMDTEIATAFQEVASRRVQGWVLKPKALKGEDLLKWQMLEDVGLIQSAVGLGGTELTLTAGPNGKACLAGNTHCLEVSFQTLKNKECKIGIVLLTRAGAQIADILPSDEVGAMREIAKRVPDQARASLGVITKLVGTDVHYTHIEVLKEFGKRGV